MFLSLLFFGKVCKELVQLFLRQISLTEVEETSEQCGCMVLITYARLLDICICILFFLLYYKVIHLLNVFIEHLLCARPCGRGQAPQ